MLAERPDYYQMAACGPARWCRPGGGKGERADGQAAPEEGIAYQTLRTAVRFASPSRKNWMEEKGSPLLGRMR